MREGMHLKNQMCDLAPPARYGPSVPTHPREVTSTPHRSQTTPRCLIRYTPHEHSQSLTRAENAFTEQAAFFRLERSGN